MRYIYTFILYLITPFIILRLYWKSRRLPAYRQRIGERFSCGTLQGASVDIWLHAVSLGEVMAATPLISALLDKGCSVMVTTMTPTGSQQVLNRFGTRVLHQYIPYDFPWALRRFFKRIKPQVGIIMETELWPNMIYQAKQYHIPLLLVNARISNRAFKQYLNVRFMFKPILNQLTAILAQSENDARRFLALGALEEHVQVAGNIKYDVQSTEVDSRLQHGFSEAWGDDRVVVILASTHQDEEAQILNRLSVLKSAIPTLLLLIAPRHPERFQAVYKLCQQYPFKTGLRSQLATINRHCDIIILDSLGELTLFYSLSHFAFVGGSLVPIGGHNVLEPIALGVPVLCGQYMDNSKSICEDLCAAKAIVKVADADALIQNLIELYRDSPRREAQVNNATAVLKANQGTLLRCMECVDKFISIHHVSPCE